MADILVIDDEFAVRRLLCDTLSVAGYAVREARDGLHGLEMARQKRPDLIVCDIQMPGMDGFGVLNHLRSDVATTDIPFIFLTAQNEREQMRAGMDMGADDFLGKPFEGRELLSAIQARLERQSALTEKFETTVRLLRKNILYSVPHELRTPLSLILGYAHLLHSAGGTLPSEQVVEYSGSILGAAEKLHHTIENFLVLAQLEALASNPAEVQALRNHITLHGGRVIGREAEQRAKAHGRGADLEMDITDRALGIAEPDLRKIVSELVDNAFKFSRPGTRVLVSAVHEDEVFTLSVSDRGRGMTAAEIAQVGEFIQFDRAVQEQQGAGMGLAIVRRLAELHCGIMTISGKPGEGTTVRIAFPS